MNASSTLETKTYTKMPAKVIRNVKIVKAEKPVRPIRKKASHFSTTGPGHVFSKFVSKVTVRPRKKLILPIGNTFTGSAPKGFSIGLSPGNEIDEDIDMQVVATGTPQKYEYKLVIENNGVRPVSAEIWAI